MDQQEQDVDDAAFEMFANNYPHEAYDSQPARFLAFTLLRCPNLTGEEIVELLDQTRAADAAGGE